MNTHTIYEVYRDAAGGWRWRQIGLNGRIVGDSGESYTRRWSVKRAIRRKDARTPIVYPLEEKGY